MSEKHNIYYGQFIKTILGDLTPVDPEKYKLFLDTLKPNQKVEVFMEANEDTGTVPQIALIHVCIRELAKELGYTFEEIKKEVKRRAGLCIKKNSEEEIFKSLADCSKDELGLVIEAINQIGETVGINFHQQSQT